ncbi:hypothetical protein [Bartonella sp. A05]|uniref:hypothetical protein n=1 Tax=Bartonella sp. A05 TaxID=2967261 RepID=UPI0022A8FA83|nr:hypothetical protein [Bartonella sp. A05]MCZ2203691.1 hypothetical protein [Bartonella sp. A05]MCZ2203692.1 hypothetical protein [Bartonella sp. A05]
MNIRYFVFICTIIAGVLTAGQANSRTVILEPAPVVAVSKTASYLYLSGQSDTTLHKVATHYTTSYALKTAWKGVRSTYFYVEKFVSFILRIVRTFVNFIDGKSS